jgi:hypothetical protein
MEMPTRRKTTIPAPWARTTPADARRLCVAEIQAGAITRQALGQAAHHRLLRDGQHEIVVGGKSSTAATLEQAIDAARSQPSDPANQ